MADDMADELTELRQALAAVEGADLLATRLEWLAELQRRVDAELADTVATARYCDLSWQLIADALGVSRQAAHERYADAVRHT